MSSITNLLLTMSILEEDDPANRDESARIKEVNAFFERGSLRRVEWLSARMYAGIFNHLDLDGFLRHLRSVPWEEPGDVQVWVREERDEHFRLVYGVEDEDPRISARDRLLFDARDLIEDLEQILEAKIITNDNALGVVRDWLQQYERLYPDE